MTLASCLACHACSCLLGAQATGQARQHASIRLAVAAALPSSLPAPLLFAVLQLACACSAFSVLL